MTSMRLWMSCGRKARFRGPIEKRDIAQRNLYENAAFGLVMGTREMQMAGLFDPLAIREVKFANRAFVSPMCQYLEPRWIR